MNETEYQAREVADFYKRLPARVNRGAWEDYHANPPTLETILQRCEWLLGGSYGAGAYYTFRQLTPRMNRRAWLFNTIHALEWDLTQRQAAKIWHALTPHAQTLLNAGLDKAIANAESPD